MTNAAGYHPGPVAPSTTDGALLLDINVKNKGSYLKIGFKKYSRL